MKNRLVKMTGAGLLAVGLLTAQTQTPTTPAPGQGNQQFRRHRGGMGRMAQALNLTDDQKAQAKQIFKDAATASKPLHDQMKQARQALQAAVKNNPAGTQVDQLAVQVGQISGQLAANRARAFGKFYSILTPDQQQKLDTFAQNIGNHKFRPAAFRNRARWGQSGQSAPPTQQQQ